MHHKTHRRIAKALLPNVPTETINRINRQMDKPPPGTPDSPDFAKLPMIKYEGHRRKGHDLLALVNGHKEAGLEGMAVVAIHLALDAAREPVTKKYGAATADLSEAIFNFLWDMHKQKAKGKVKANKRKSALRRQS
jgi:hypothetical protein